MEQQIEQSIENDVSDAEEEVVEMLLVVDVLKSRHLIVLFCDLTSWVLFGKIIGSFSSAPTAEFKIQDGCQKKIITPQLNGTRSAR